MAQLYSTGPCDIWLQWWSAAGGSQGSREAPLFLGHGIQAPVIEEHPSWVDIHCDLTGRVPIDKLDGGSVATVSVELVRYNESVLERAQVRAQGIGAFAAGDIERGMRPPGTIGTLGVTENAVPRLFVVFPYSAKPAFQNAAAGLMPDGYRFFAAFLGPDSTRPGASDAKTVRLNWACVGVLTDDTNVFGVLANTVYDHDVDEVTESIT